MANYIQINLEDLALNEDSLNLEADDVSSPESKRRQVSFKDRLLIDGSVVPPEAARIPKSEIDVLYSKVNHLANIECVAGLLVHFACKNNAGVFEFIPLFQPILLQFYDYDPISLTDIYSLKDQGKVYYFSGARFVECRKEDEHDEEMEWRNNYRSNHTTIKRAIDITQPFSPFISSIDSESQLFPFQLIYALMRDNNNDEIVFTNCMSEFRKNPSVFFKHSMFLSSPPKMGGGGDFYGKHANRSHLCPPCIDRFGFSVNHL
ncbi:hypothetical protein [Fluviicola taffensis]|uniref:hypothetical protein n=1 Tax=Fluviicola taffensis TaxID=191579 RepID=UPI00313777D9